MRGWKGVPWFLLISSYNVPFTDKDLTQAIGYNDINIQPLSFTIRNR